MNSITTVVQEKISERQSSSNFIMDTIFIKTDYKSCCLSSVSGLTACGPSTNGEFVLASIYN